MSADATSRCGIMRAGMPSASIISRDQPRAAKSAAEYLTAYLEPDFKPDPRAASEPGFNPAIKPPIDGAFVWFRRARPDLVTVFADLGYQRSSRTDVGAKKWFDRIIGVRELVGLARRVVRRLRRPAEA